MLPRASRSISERRFKPKRCPVSWPRGFIVNRSFRLGTDQAPPAGAVFNHFVRLAFGTGAAGNRRVSNEPTTTKREENRT
jgi:hypothetical protein